MYAICFSVPFNGLVIEARHSVILSVSSLLFTPACSGQVSVSQKRSLFSPSPSVQKRHAENKKFPTGAQFFLRNLGGRPPNFEEFR